MKFFVILLLMGSLCTSTASSRHKSSSGSSSSSSSSSSDSSSSSSSESSSAEEVVDRKIKYTYTLWIGDDVDKKYSINLKCKSGTTFLKAMNQAADEDKHFRFEKVFHPVYGALVTKICGLPNDESMSWILYELPSMPDVENKPCDRWRSTTGVGSIMVVERYYLFWYKRVTNVNTSQCVNFAK